MQFVYHCFGIGPVSFVEFPVALYSPVEEVDDNLVNVDAFLLILASYGQYLVLGTVTQLALP